MSKILIDEATVKLVLEALKQIDEAMPFPVAKLAQAALREALAKPDFWEGYVPEPVKPAQQALDRMAENARELGLDYEPAQQEPVAWMVYTLDGKSVFVTDNPADFTPDHRALPLYTSPPAQRTWVGLTDEEIDHFCHLAYTGDEELVLTIQARLKEKNA